MPPLPAAPWIYASIDDEPASHEALRVLMRPHADFVDGGRFLQPQAASAALAATPVDLVFVDARMPGTSGLQWLRDWPQPRIAVLLTAYAEYAMLAWEAGVRETLLKPLAPGMLDAALDRLRPLLRHQREQGGPPGAVPLAFADGTGHRLVTPADVLAIDAAPDAGAARLVLCDRTLPVTEGLGDLERRLLPFGFVRVHRRHLVNRAHVVSLRADEVRLSHGIARPVGAAYREALSEPGAR